MCIICLREYNDFAWYCTIKIKFCVVQIILSMCSGANAITFTFCLNEQMGKLSRLVTKPTKWHVRPYCANLSPTFCPSLHSKSKTLHYQHPIYSVDTNYWVCLCLKTHGLDNVHYVETELTVTECALHVNMECMPFVKE